MKRILYILALISSVSHAQYVQLGNKLVGTGNTGQSWQGRSVSISSDGKTAVVGGSGDNSSIGAVWVYTWNGSNFVQFGNKLVGSNYVGASEQGHTVAISSDGKVVVVGGLHDDVYGAAWIYTFNGTNFVQVGNKLVGTGVTYHGGIGTGVSISGDGKTVVLAAGYNDGGVGAFWIYTFNGSNFVQAGNKMSVSGSVGGSIISSCQISLDSKTIVFGGGADNGNTGAIWIFTFNGSNFVQAGSKLVGTNAIGSASQGQSVSISADGKTILAGGAYDNSIVGAAWIYTFNGTNYVQAGNKLVGSGSITTTGVYQGASTSLSSDGKIAWIGGNWDNSHTGAIWVFTFNGNSFVQAGNKIVANDGVGDPYNGTSVSLSGDGKTAITGGIYDNTLLGAAWIFVNTSCGSSIDLQNGLVAYYPFNGNANDASGSNNNGTVVGAVLTTDRLGNLNSAYDFSGGTLSNPQYINFSSDQSKKVSGDKLSISVWIKINGNGINSGRIFLGGEVNNQYGIYKHDLTDDRILLRPVIQGQSQNFGEVFTKSNISRNTWHHIVGIYDGSKTMIYLDGQLNNSTLGVSGLLTTNSESSLTGGETALHSGTANTSVFDGSIDEIYIYNKVLSDCEIALLYGGFSICTTITNISISGLSSISNCSPTAFSVINSTDVFYNWSTTSGVISNPTSSTISGNWTTPGVYPLSVTVLNRCSTITSTINVTVTSNLSIIKPIIGRNEDNLVVNNTVIDVNYKWLLNSSIEPGQNSYNHTATLKDGIYQVSASSVTPCLIVLSDPRNVLAITEVFTVTNYEIECITAIEDLQKSTVEVYPNPGSGLFNLRSENIIISTIEVFNCQGQMVYNKPFINTIDLTKQPSGIYLIRLYDQLGILAKTIRIIIE